MPKNKKYIVEVKEVWTLAVEVEVPANATKEQILDAANDKIEEGDNGESQYDYTLDPDEWTVRDEEGKHL
jgi:hypothetical protein